MYKPFAMIGKREETEISLVFHPASGSFPMNQFVASGGQSIGVSASTSDLPMNIQD